MSVGKKFMHRHEGLSVCAGLWRSGYTAYRLEYGKPPVWYWNNSNWPNHTEYEKGQWLPILKNPNRLYNGCDIAYVYNSALIFGQLIDYDAMFNRGEHLAIVTGNGLACYVPREYCKMLEWVENKKPKLRVVA